MTLLDRRSLLLGTLGVAALAACGNDATASGGSGGTGGTKTLSISAIPDQDPELLNRLYPLVAERFSSDLGITARYVPVTDYTAVVRAFEIGDIQLAWMGGLTGVQARVRVPGAQAIAQRDIDADFHSLFIANKSAGITPFTGVSGLKQLAGHTLTYGSETSTSGRLMPQYYLQQAGLDESELKGTPGYSGSHDATIAAVASGSFEVGAVNEQVWKATVEAGTPDVSDVVVLWRTPGYPDYHWLVRPDLDKTLGAGMTTKVTDLILGLDITKPDDAAILKLFGAQKFVPTQNSNYDRIEVVAKEQGLLA